MVHMIPERDTDSVAPTPTPQHPRHSQHHHLSLHELRALQVCRNISFTINPRGGASATVSDNSSDISNVLLIIINGCLFTAKKKYGESRSIIRRDSKPVNFNLRRLLQRRPECTGNSSSDENRSSGHASMSDTGGHTSSSSPPHRHHRTHSPQQLNAVPEDDRLSASVTQRNGRGRSGQNRNRHRATPAKVPRFIIEPLS
jgi:hypothetical protein